MEELLQQVCTQPAVCPSWPAQMGICKHALQRVAVCLQSAVCATGCTAWCAAWWAASCTCLHRNCQPYGCLHLYGWQACWQAIDHQELAQACANAYWKSAGKFAHRKLCCRRSSTRPTGSWTISDSTGSMRGGCCRACRHDCKSACLSCRCILAVVQSSAARAACQLLSRVCTAAARLHDPVLLQLSGALAQQRV